MTTIHLTTEIKAPIGTCFHLAKDVDVHKLSTSSTKERAITGRTTGLCEQGDIITWQAKHFGLKQNLTVEITQLNKPYFFADKMLKGAFKSMQHQHSFEEKNGITIMIDKFEYEVPFGIIGKIFDKFILKNYMTRFLLERNRILKEFGETR
ncbi:MAG: SRPBCC family protein [Bacteroidota bacterium]|nr:SRPBCC family protein [Bacteroidota bacterium]